MSRTTSRRRWRLPVLVAAVLTLIAGTAITTLTSASAATITPGTWYNLINAHSNKLMEIENSSTADAAAVRQWSSTGCQCQQFRFEDAGSGYWRIIARHSGKAIDLYGWNTADGAEYRQWTITTGVNQHFSVQNIGDNIQLINRHSGKSLDLWEWDTTDGARISQYTDTNALNQQWKLVTAGTGTPTTATVASDGTGTYRTVQAAIDAVPANNTSRRVITIKAGTYREIVTIPSNKPYVTLQGLGGSASNTVIVNNHSSAGGYGTSGSATVFVNGHDFIATNLTMSNDYGEGSQAVAANVNADRSVFNNVRFLGNQDTLLLNNYRSYYVNSYVEGTVDFIFGSGTGVFNASTIYERRSTGGPITASRTDPAVTYGFLFYKCTITGAANNVTQLGRPWGAAAQVLYRESNLSATIRTAQPWTDMSGNTWQNARFLEYKNTGSGAGTNGNRPQLSDSQAANYTPQRYLAGSDGWNPV